ncbi:MnhB domain-containing protein [Amorphus orientalis]|uniref:Multisubunit Na+/H+ antiporter MnhB subunit n=1 Tax=Amorphus orientalis TaxID=649198 RepID=A0AAE4AUI5_9HYPH|nr:MnhB domain-containing protein [Amorphus orientalis]MDQ0317488.1 multisubunit Na+/H+ antiporter MnhB subunit [Amorphus orientalis]
MKGVSGRHGTRPVLPSPILAASAGLLATLMAAVAVIILLRGHNAPGGGFIGGLVGAGALVVIAYAFGVRKAQRLLRVHPVALAGWGLALALISGLPGLLGGVPYLTHLWGDIESEVGVLKVGTTYVFDLGVFLVVVGAVSAFFFLFEEN